MSHGKTSVHKRRDRSGEGAIMPYPDAYVETCCPARGCKQPNGHDYTSTRRGLRKRPGVGDAAHPYQDLEALVVPHGRGMSRRAYMRALRWKPRDRSPRHVPSFFTHEVIVHPDGTHERRAYGAQRV